MSAKSHLVKAISAAVASMSLQHTVQLYEFALFLASQPRSAASVKVDENVREGHFEISKTMHSSHALLSESEARYRSSLEDQTELICRYLPDGQLSFVNEAYAHSYDTPPDKL